MAGRETRQYWIDQLTEYWESGFTIQEYCELKDLPYESTRRWIAQLKTRKTENVRFNLQASPEEYTLNLLAEDSLEPGFRHTARGKRTKSTAGCSCRIFPGPCRRPA